MLFAISPLSFFPLFPLVLIMHYLRDKQPGPQKREKHLSNNGKRRSFPKVPHLLQYVISDNGFGKVKIIGKSVGRVCGQRCGQPRNCG
jgi:hypothetical protein